MSIIVIRILIFFIVLGILFSIGFFPLALRLARKTNIFKQNMDEIDKELKNEKL